MDLTAAALIGLGAAYSMWLFARRGAPPSKTPSSPVSVSGGTIVGPHDVVYHLTQDDLLWLGRAIVGEAGDNPSRRSAAAIAWALAQNFALIPSSRGGVPRFSTFTGLVRAYCQPVNPSWSVAGDGKCLEIPSACTPAHIARRARISSLSWNQLGAVQGYVQDFAAGRLENPVPGMVDWLAGPWDGGQVNIGGNVFGVREGRRLVG